MSTLHFGSYTELTRDYREAVEAALDEYTQFGGRCPDRLQEALRHSLLAPGKRLRPILVLLATEACGGARQAALPAACAVEMVHTYSLIHDDLPAMDDDDMRRGQPSCHARYGEAMAILAGDALQALAFEIIARDTQPPTVAACAAAALAQAAGATAMVAGQADDLAAPGTAGSLAQLESIHQRKTGAMFRVALQIGALVAVADADQIAALDTYGRCLGLAFQIIDDLLDLQGDTEVLGKHTGKDQAQGKLTFPALLGVEASHARAAELIDQAVTAVASFGAAADGLQRLAQFVLARSQ